MIISNIKLLGWQLQLKRQAAWAARPQSLRQRAIRKAHQCDDRKTDLRRAMNRRRPNLAKIMGRLCRRAVKLRKTSGGAGGGLARRYRLAPIS